MFLILVVMPPSTAAVAADHSESGSLEIDNATREETSTHQTEQSNDNQSEPDESAIPPPERTRRWDGRSNVQKKPFLPFTKNVCNKYVATSLM